jgi:E3 ubiquitin-protein ligase HUWE1
VENGTNCDEEALISLLEHALAQNVWVFPRSDLHQWADLLDRFDGLYGRIIDEYWSKTTGLQEKNFTENDKRLSSSMMKFSRLLLEYCSSRNLYNSYEHLRKYLVSSDLDVLESTLELLLLPARKLESQPSLRNTFERLVGPEELGVLAQINVPPFVEPRKDSVLEAFQPYHTQRLKMSTVPQDQLKYIRMLAMACYLLLMSTSGLELDSSLFAANPTIIGDIARSLTAKPVTPMKRETAALCVLRASLKIHSKASEIIYALNLSAGHGPVASLLRAICDSLKAKEEPPFHPFFVGAFLDFLAALGMNSMIGDGDIALVNAGVIEDIIKSLGDCSPTQYKVPRYVIFSCPDLIKI